MANLTLETTVNAPLEAVWAFHDNPPANPPLAAPPARPPSAQPTRTPLAVGSRIAMRLDGPFGTQMRWVAEIVEHAPPHAVVFGMEARFVYEQVNGPFVRWRHEHEFEALDWRTTRVLERIAYRLPLGPLGWLGDWIYIRWKVRAMMRRQVHTMARALEASGRPQ